MRILLAVHGFPPAGSGGTEIYVAAFARALADLPGVEVSVLTRDADPNRPEYSVRGGTTPAGVRVFRINNTFQACTSFEESYTNPSLGAVARDVIDAIDPDVVHVQHLTCLSTGIIEHAASGSRARPVVMTLNDYWLICHRGQLMRPDDSRCDGPFDGGCEGCVPAGMLARPAVYRMGRIARALPLPGLGTAVRAAQAARAACTSAAVTRDASRRRLEHLRAVSAKVEMFLAPSATMEGWALRFGIARSKLERCDQGIDLSGFGTVPARRAGDTLRLAFAGSLIPSKAPHVLLDAVASLPAGRVTVDLLGTAAPYHGDTTYRDRLMPRLGEAFIRKRGPVPHDRVPHAFRDVDALVVPSVWIENAPFVIREAFAAGLPVIASDLGGMAEMIVHERNGLLFAPGDAGDLARQIRRLLDDPGLLARLQRGVMQPMSIQEDAAETFGRYERLASRRSAAQRTHAARPSATTPLRAVVLNYRTPQQTWLAAHSIASSTVAPRVIVIDNGSDNGSAEWLRSAIPGADVVATSANLGFSGGCNAGIRKALDEGAELVLLVNSDAVLEPRAIERLLAAADAHQDAGIFAPVLLSREEPDRIASAGIRYSEKTGRMRQIGAGRPISMLPAQAVRRVDAVSGCVVLVRADVFARAGLLDESFFFSFEDIEFCLRARRAGFETLCVQDAIAYHEGGRSIGRTSPDRLYYAARNHLRLAAMTDDGRGRRWLRSGVVVALNAGYALVSGETPRLRGLSAVARGTWHHLGRRYGPA